MKISSKQVISLVIILVAVIAGYSLWSSMHSSIPDGFAVGNGRIEATEIDVATKLAGRVEQVFVDEGDFVTKGQKLAEMQIDVLEAQLYEAKAQYHKAVAAAASARANIILRESDMSSAKAIVAEKESQLDAAERKLSRSSKLSKTGAMSMQEFDDDETRVTGAKAAVDSAMANVTVAEASVEAAKAEYMGAEANIKAAEATVSRIEADINDSTLVAPRDGRVQYRVAQPGEVLGAGGKVLNLVDLSDVYMTFFLPSAQAGRLNLGGEARIVLDLAPEYPVPAKISFVSSIAQFTPKTVETEQEREKLMFRVKAQIDRDLLIKYLTYVKTGLPGVCWVQIKPDLEWPKALALDPKVVGNE